MEALVLLLFERMGILLIVTFILTRIPLFRQLLDRKRSVMNTIYFSCLFGLFGRRQQEFYDIRIGQSGND